MPVRFLCLITLTLGLPGFGWEVRTDSAGDVVRWPGAIELVLDARAASVLHEPATESAIHAAFAHLGQVAPALDVRAHVGETLPLGYVPDAPVNQNSILVLEDWPFAEDAIAVTIVTIDASTNEFLDADIAFNPSHVFRVLGDQPRGSVYDVQNTFMHELGHALGLMHNRDLGESVMYPTSPPGETTKRKLKSDDRQGLLSLYPGGLSAEPAVGCSVSPVGSGWLLAPLLLLGLRRRAALLVAVVPALALAAEPLPAAVTRADDCALVQVVARVSSLQPEHPGLFVTDLALAPVECLKGSCATLVRVRVAGGRLGQLEQVVAHEPVPAVGDHVLVTRTAGRARVIRLEGEVLLRTLVELKRLPAGPLPPKVDQAHSRPTRSLRSPL
ncbi:MAG: matrixin family metalloprotease [Archangium sp.]|nr:matrixin family metalloprotease [Archangium sp.]